ncbi:MAG: glycosyltransferase [Pseudomonadota bacterium]|nr:glycosyltransferase [Pseudomonadota bacterium]
MLLTVLICTHDRVALLGKTLASLNVAERPAGWRVEILVIANACSDTTHAFLDESLRAPNGRLPLRWHAEPAPGKSHALNLAIALIESDLVAFVDDDHRVDTAYLKAVCQAADTYPEADLFCGRILPDWDGTEPAWVHDSGPYRIYPLPVPRFDLGEAPQALNRDIAVPGGGNLFLRGSWLKRVGPFSVELGPVGHNLGGAEDIEWVLRALDLGARLRYVPEVVQHHYVDNERLQLRYLLAKAFERSASTVRVNSAHDGGIPLYMYRKLFGYFFSALTAWSNARRRFFQVRLAASLGEIKGYRQAHRDRLKRKT